MIGKILKKLFGKREAEPEKKKVEPKQTKDVAREANGTDKKARGLDRKERTGETGNAGRRDRFEKRGPQQPRHETGRNQKFEKRPGSAANRQQKEQGKVPQRQLEKPSQKRPEKAPQRQPEKPLEKKSTWEGSQFVVLPAEGQKRFHDFDLPPEVMHAIYDLGFQYCTPIQAGILPNALEGLDSAGRAQTGTGKTAAFLIAIITRFLNNPLKEPVRKSPRALILAPTRELAIQIKKDADGLTKYTDLNVITVLGGVEYKEQRELLAGPKVDIVVATPGRLLDFKKQGIIKLDKVEILVIDEADRMLDMGFIPDVRRIIESTPPKSNRQTMLFSATLTPEVNRLASRWTHEPNIVEIEPEQVVVKTIKQVFYLTTDSEKFKILYNLIAARKLDRVMVFANRKDTARDLKDRLSSHGINAALLSGDVEQLRRIKRLENFRSGQIAVLVATDVAARGIHVEGISHVVNYNLPQDAEDYVHRIGRTGRAGASGISISFATETDAYSIPAIKKFLGEDIPSIYPEDDLLTPLPEPKFPMPKKGPPRRSRYPRRQDAHSHHSGRPPRRK